MNHWSLAAETNVSDPPRFAERVGLLAGAGRFPFHFVDSARQRGIEVVCVAIAGQADRGLAGVVDRLYWTGVAKLGRMIRLFRRERIDCVVMAGKVRKVAMFDAWRVLRYWPDWRMIRVWFAKRRDNRDDSLLLAAIAEFNKDGIRVASALEICPELLVKDGVLTRRQPNDKERRDIAFGWELAKEMGRLDVGQSVAVMESAVLAVEAIEGTDATILRAGSLCQAGGFTVVKVAKPQQDMRFDVPAAGVQTIETMHRAGARVLALEAGKTILMDGGETIRRANELGITIIALTAEQALAPRKRP